MIDVLLKVLNRLWSPPRCFRGLAALVLAEARASSRAAWQRSTSKRATAELTKTELLRSQASSHFYFSFTSNILILNTYNKYL